MDAHCILLYICGWWGFDECHIQTKTHKHQLNPTMGHCNVSFLWKQKGFEVDKLIS
jgi:hypothetical protein